MRGLFILVLAVSSVAASMPAALRQRQATRTTVLERLFNRDSAPVPSTVPCTCVDYGNQACPGGCLARCSELAPPAPTPKRGLPDPITWSARGFMPRREYAGAFLDPPHAALFLAHGGDFVHANGTRVRDETYIANSLRLRSMASRAFPLHKLVSRAGGHLIRLGGRLIAGRMMRMIGDPNEEGHDLVLPFSADLAIPMSDVVPTIRLLLVDETMMEVNVYHHSITRGMLEDILAVMCPRLGEKICGAEDIDFGPPLSDGSF